MEILNLLNREVENNNERKNFICDKINKSDSKLVEKIKTHPNTEMSKMLLISFRLCLLFFQHIEKLKNCPLDYSKIDMDEFCIKVQNDVYGDKVPMKTKEQATEYFKTLISHFNL